MVVKRYHVLCFFIYILLLFLSYLVATRDVAVGTDTVAYINIFHRAISSFYEVETEPLYLALNRLIGFFSGDYRVFFFICALLFFVFNWRMIVYSNGCVFFDGKKNTDLSIGVLSFYLFSPFFFNAAVNILRQGLATPFLIMAYFALYQRKYFVSVVLFSVSVGFHSSSIMFFILSPFIFFRQLWLFLGVALLSVFYLLGVVDQIFYPFFAILGLESYIAEIQEYGSSSGYRGGARWDFFLFSFFLIFCAFWGYLKGYYFDALFKIMMVLFTPFLFFGYMNYSDRLLFPLWHLAPIALFAPFVNFFNKVMQKGLAATVVLFLSSSFFACRLFFY